jgi:glyoxylase-like metal-dependent hydrolase (beta-lactamase superfamily II)
VNYTWERLTASVYRCRLPFLDVTVGLVQGSAGVLLVDAGTTIVEAVAIDADVAALTQCAVTHIVLTHKHFDHVLASSAFPGAAVYCAPEVAAYVRDGREQLRDDAVCHGADAVEVDRAIAALRPPDHAVHDAVIDLGERIVSISHPGRGHTTADLIVSIPQVASGVSGAGRSVVFCGDLVEEAGDPVIDADSDVTAWPATLDRILEVGGQDALYVPGHGAVVDSGFVRRQRNWLQSCRLAP